MRKNVSPASVGKISLAHARGGGFKVKKGRLENVEKGSVSKNKRRGVTLANNNPKAHLRSRSSREATIKAVSLLIVPKSASEAGDFSPYWRQSL